MKDRCISKWIATGCTSLSTLSSAWAASSDVERGQKDFRLGVIAPELLGVTLGWGVGAEAYVSDRVSAEATLEWGDLDLKLVAQEVRFLTAWVRFYPFSSLNFAAGLAHEHTETKVTDYVVSPIANAVLGGDQLPEARLVQKYLDLRLSVGSAWQWDNFSFGVDWLGLVLPLKRLSVEIHYQGRAANAPQGSLKRATDFGYQLVPLTLLGLRWGWAF